MTANEFFSIKSERLLIAPLSIAELRQLVDQQDIPELRQAYQEMLDGCLRHPEQCIWYAPWNISLSGNPTKSIGELGFKGPAVDGAVEIGYGLHPGYEGHGYMTEAVRAIIKWAFFHKAKNLSLPRADENTRTEILTQETLFYLPELLDSLNMQILDALNDAACQ